MTCEAIANKLRLNKFYISLKEEWNNMEPLERIFRNFGKGNAKEVKLGIYAYQVKELDGGSPGFIGLGVEIEPDPEPGTPPEIKILPPEFKMAVVSFWPEMPTSAGYEGPQLHFSMQRYPPAGAENTICASMRSIRLKNPPDKFSREIVSNILPIAQAICTIT